MQFSIVKDQGRRNIMVVDPSLDQPLAASEEHPNFDKIVAAVVQGESADVVARLFDTAKLAAERFERLSERVSVRGGRIYLDGDEIDNSLTRQVVRFAEDGEDDWKPLVNFFEKVQSNPLNHSREQLFDFLNANDFTITEDGDIVGYKGVNRHEDDEEGVYRSTTAGPNVIRNGEPLEHCLVPQSVGDIIEMPRSTVAHDPGQSCSYGLHVATWDYAQNYGHRGAILKVLVNPRDVVSVPRDASGAKVRVCRYVVADILDERITSALDRPNEPEPEDYEGEFPVGARVRAAEYETVGVVVQDDGPDDEPRYKVVFQDAPDLTHNGDPIWDWFYAADLEFEGADEPEEEPEEERCYDCSEYESDCTCGEDDEDDEDY